MAGLSVSYVNDVEHPMEGTPMFVVLSPTPFPFVKAPIVLVHEL